MDGQIQKHVRQPMAVGLGMFVGIHETASLDDELHIAQRQEIGPLRDSDGALAAWHHQRSHPLPSSMDVFEPSATMKQHPVLEECACISCGQSCGH